MCMWLHLCMNLERDELSTTYQLGHTSFQLSHWAKQLSGISGHVPFCVIVEDSLVFSRPGYRPHRAINKSKAIW